jgi:peptidoglycan endopeptidase LytF/peptidoglycan endopeptidase LytE
MLGTMASRSAAMAWSGCGSSYVVQSGDTLGTIASRCGTTVAALRLANPNLGYWIYAGQTIWLPGAVADNGNGYATYIVQRGDTLRSIADRLGTTAGALASLNGIYNYNLIYVGQRLNIPTGNSVPAPNPYPNPQPGPVSAGTYVVQWGDTLRKIATRMNVSLSDLIAVNPQIANPSVIYFGQVINLPASSSVYTVQRGDTMRIIAARYGTTVDGLLGLNPQIWNANWIYAGQVIRVR